MIIINGQMCLNYIDKQYAANVVENQFDFENTHSMNLRFKNNKQALSNLYSFSFETMQQFVNLQNLSLQFGHNLDQKCQQFISGFSNSVSFLKNLTYLKIKIGYQNQLKDRCSQQLGGYFEYLPQLKCLEIIIKDQIDSQDGVSIFKNIGRLINLEKLTIELKGYAEIKRGISSIGDALENLTNLKYLKIFIGKKNLIGAVGIKSLSQSFKYLKELSELDLNIEDNYLRQEGAICLGEGISQLINLTILKLIIGSQNKIDSTGSIGLGTGIGKLLKLRTLHLQIKDSNNITPEGAIAFANGIQNLKNLEMLDLSISIANNILTKGAEAIGESFKGLPILKKLNLTINSNYIGKEGADSISQGLANLQNLQDLTITMHPNNIKHSKFGESFSFLQQNLRILRLKIYQNSIKQEGAKILGEGFKSLVNLECLELLISTSNEIQSQGAISIGEGIENLTNLKELTLQIGIGNNISSEGAIAIGKGLVQLIKLQYLKLQIEADNNIRKEGAIGIADGLQHLKLIQKIDLQIRVNNNIQKEGATAISNSLSQLTSITQLQLDTSIEDLSSISECFPRLINIQSLILIPDLGFNRKIISESIPVISNRVSRLQKLRVLTIKNSKAFFFRIIRKSHRIVVLYS